MKTKTTKPATSAKSKTKVVAKVATNNPPSPAKASKTKKAKGPAEIPADAIEKMTKWNEAHPDKKFSWVIVSVEMPAPKRTCRTCKKEFREGRVTRVDATGAYCGPRCQLKSSN